MPSLSLSINTDEDWFCIKNIGSDAANLKGYAVQDQGVFEGRTKRNDFSFSDDAKLGPGESVTVYSGKGSSKAREYDGTSTIHWFNFSVWNSADDVAYLLNPEGDLVTTSGKVEEVAADAEPAAVEDNASTEAIPETASTAAPEAASTDAIPEAASTEAVPEAASTEATEEPATTPAETTEEPGSSSSPSKYADAVPVKNPDVERPNGIKLTGVCKWFNTRKSFGFLHDLSDGGPEVFVHSTSIKSDDEVKALVHGQKYEFTWVVDSEEQKQKGGKHDGRASDVTQLGGAAVATHASQHRAGFVKRLEANPDIKLGIVKWFNPVKGYGFIVPFGGNADEKDIFVHVRELLVGQGITSLAEGTHVEYKLSKTEKKDKDGNAKTTATSVTAPGGEMLGVAQGGIMGPGGPMGGHGMMGHGGPQFGQPYRQPVLGRQPILRPGPFNARSPPMQHRPMYSGTNSRGPSPLQSPRFRQQQAPPFRQQQSPPFRQQQSPRHMQLGRKRKAPSPSVLPGPPTHSGGYGILPNQRARHYF